MPDLKASPATTAAAHAHARRRANSAVYTTALTPLQQAHFNAIARANKVVSREPNLITTFALSAEIEQIETQASASFAKNEIEAYTVLCIVARRLTALIPV